MKKKLVPQNKRSIWMHFNKSNIIRVSIPLLDFFLSVIIVYAEFHVVSGCDKPLLSGNKFRASHGSFAELKTFHQGLTS